MAVDKSVWLHSFSRNNVPLFPCPRCRKPTLKLESSLLISEETAISKSNRKHDAWEPDWINEKFAALLKCSASKCGEIVAISGRISVEPDFEDDEEEGGWSFEDMLEPKSMFPAPPIITLPQGLPKTVEQELDLAFQYYWSDYGACATKIRTSVERLMDHFKITKFKIVKTKIGPKTRGKMRPLDLASRIDKFISATGAVVHKDHLHALRVVGNLGTHKDVLTRTEILDAFEIYEHALDELIGKKSTKIGQLAKKLSRHTGKAKKSDFLPF